MRRLLKTERTSRRRRSKNDEIPLSAGRAAGFRYGADFCVEHSFPSIVALHFVRRQGLRMKNVYTVKRQSIK